MKECVDEAVEYQWFLKDKNCPVSNAMKPKVLAINDDSKQLEDLIVNVMKEHFKGNNQGNPAMGKTRTMGPAATTPEPKPKRKNALIAASSDTGKKAATPASTITLRATTAKVNPTFPRSILQRQKGNPQPGVVKTSCSPHHSKANGLSPVGLSAPLTKAPGRNSNYVKCRFVHFQLHQ